MTWLGMHSTDLVHVYCAYSVHMSRCMSMHMHMHTAMHMAMHMSMHKSMPHVYFMCTHKSM